MNFHFTASAQHAIKVLPILAATFALSLALPVHAVNAATITGAVGTVGAAPPPPPPPDLPDLQVTVSADGPNGLGAYPFTNGYTATVTVYNVGWGSSAPTALKVNCTCWSTSQSVSVPALSPTNQSTIFHFTFVRYSWSCERFEALVDPRNTVAESNETNNYASTFIGC